MTRFVLALMSVVAVFVGASQTVAAPVQWKVQDGGNGHWYEAVYSDQPVSPNGYQVVDGTTVAAYAGGITWTAARDAATAKGGWLTDITSEAENTFVYNLIARSQHPGFWFSEQYWINCQAGPWIGGFQPSGSPEPGGNWQWVTGSQFTDANSVPIGYTNWYPDQPGNSYWGNSGVPEDALHYYERTNENVPVGKWNDFPSWAVTNGYVVEFNSVPEPSTVSLLGAGAVSLLTVAWRRRQS
jgi:hypothetical protein